MSNEEIMEAPPQRVHRVGTVSLGLTLIGFGIANVMNYYMP